MNRRQTTISTYNQAAEAYQDKFMEMDLYDDTYDSFCESIDNPNASILEIASGPGNVTRQLLNRHPEYTILGIDLAPNMVKLATQNVPEASFKVMNCLEIDQLQQSFDAVMCGFCLPYLSKEECALLIMQTSNLLNKGGVIYLSTMEGDYKKSGFETTSFTGANEVFIYYHQREVLENALKQNGFDIIKFETKKYPEPDGTFLTDLIFIAKKS